MKRIVYIAILGLLLSSVGCTRNTVVPSADGGAIYQVRGLVDGEEITIAAGESGVVLHPTYDQTDYGVYNYVGDFRGSANNPQGLRILINDDTQSWPGDQVSASEILEPSTKSFQEEIDLAYNVIELRTNWKEGDQYQWTINGELQMDTDSLIDQFVVTPGSELSIDLIVENGDCTDELNLNVDQQFSIDAPIDYGFFTWRYATNDSLVCEFVGDRSVDSSITWTAIGEFGEQITGEGASFRTIPQDEGIYAVTMQVVHDDGTFFKYTENIPSPLSEDLCAANVMFRTKVENLADNGLNDVVLEYTDETGAIYRSDLADNAFNSFDILEDVGSITNELGQDSRVLRVAFDCTLVNVLDSSDSIELEEFAGTIAVSYPQ